MKTIEINPKFGIGETVYLIHDNDQKSRMVNGYYVRLNGGKLTIAYALICSTEETGHYEHEISRDKTY